MSKLKLFIENFLVYGLGGIISKIIPFVMIPIITRLMPSTDYFGISVTDLIDEHTPEEIAADAEQALVDKYTLDPQIRRLVLYAGGIEPGEARDKYVGAVLLALRAMCEAGKK